MKPLIGLNLDIKQKDTAQARIAAPYYEAIEKAGGIPVLIPPMSDASLRSLLKRVGGVLLIGGRDYSPSLFGEDASELVKPVHPQREEFDVRLAKLALHLELPILGICGGCQLLNVVLGGSLIQDIEAARAASETKEAWVEHTNAYEIAYHAVDLLPGSALAKIYRTHRLDSTVSSHHQAAKVLGAGLKTTAVAADGIIEAIELPDARFVIGVQWHPERDYAGNERLFKALVRHSRRAPV